MIRQKVEDYFSIFQRRHRLHWRGDG